MKRILFSGLVFVAALLLAGCSGPTVDAATRDKYTTVEAQRLCDVSRNTYPSSEALDQAFTKAMNDSGISLEDEKTLREQREDDPKLRAEIATKFESICR